MAYKARINNGIWMQESDYGDSPARKLERTSLVRTMFIPLQQGFDSDSQRSLSIAIDGLTAFLALEHGIVGTMSLPNSTAVGTPFRCVPTINDVQMNIIVKAPLFENAFEAKEWDSHDGSVEPLPLRIKPFEFFNGDVSIISVSQSDYFTNYLTEICSYEVPFIFSNLFDRPFCLETSFIGIGLEHSSPLHDFPSPDPNMLSEIGLVKDFTIRGKNADCIRLGINIDTENILPMTNFLFFGQESNNLEVFGQSECLANPSIRQQIGKSLVIPVLFDGNGDALSRIKTESNKEISLRAERLAISGDIELYGQCVDFIRLAVPSITNERTANLDIERGVCLAC